MSGRSEAPLNLLQSVEYAPECGMCGLELMTSPAFMFIWRPKDELWDAVCHDCTIQSLGWALAGAKDHCVTIAHKGSNSH